MLQGKKILLGISGSIAAYKSILLVRLLVKAGAEVKVIITSAARDFVSPLVLSTLSKNEVLQDLATGNAWANHVMLGRWADVMLIAPLSCNSLAKMANGLCDNLLMAVYLSATCPVIAVPAMDEDMWLHASTQNNIKTVQSFGNLLIPVNKGELGSGLVGLGRMAEPEEIIVFLEKHFSGNKTSKQLIGKTALVTAGPTHEPLDPVRFLGNRSSGKMGIAIANCLHQNGAEVYLVLGPTNLKPIDGVKTIHVETALEMYDICMSKFPKMDLAIMAAAVADYRPQDVATNKIKKEGERLAIELIKNPDILKSCGEIKKSHQLLIGFALETNNEMVYAKEKLIKKNADAIILNSLNDVGAGFATDTNKITIFERDDIVHPFETMTKTETAERIVSFIINKFALKDNLV